MSNADRIPPVCAEGCAWMPMPERHTGSNEVIAAAILSPGGWEHIQARGWSGDVLAAARLMRKLGPEEDPNENPDARFLSLSAGWDSGPAAGNEHGNSEIRHPAGWYAPVRFVGKVPDFGETGLRVQDGEEEPRPPYETCTGCSWEVRERDPRGCEEHHGLTPITLPPLPKPEREEPAGSELLLRANEAEVARLCTENGRLQARLREVERERDEAIKAYEYAQRVIEMRTVERDEAQDELKRVREVARAAAVADQPRNRIAVLRRIADGGV